MAVRLTAGQRKWSKFTGPQRAADNLNAVIRKIENRTLAGVEKAARFLIPIMKENTPVDTGKLIDSYGLMRMTQKNPAVRIYNSDPKAIFVHDRYDQKHAKGGAGFMYNAVLENKPEIVRIIAEEAKSATAGQGGIQTPKALVKV